VQALTRILLLSGGSAAVVLGVIGIVVPVLPTTPFLLLAAFCYARSSERVHRWLITHRWLGPYIESYRSGRGLSTRQFVWTIIPLWLSIALGIVIVPLWWHRAILLACATGVTIYLSSRRRPSVSTELQGT
jgi:uncharacterized protein